MDVKMNPDIPSPYDHIQAPFEAYAGDEPYLFISYSHANKNTVYPILAKLHDSKFRIWFDEACETGNDFREELRAKIRDCAAVLLFISKESMASKYCSMEIIVATEYGKKIHPINIDNCALPPAFEMLLTHTHHGTIEDIDKLVRNLTRDLPAEAMDRLKKDSNGKVLIECKDNGETIEVDEGIETIKDNAFKERRALKRITLPESLKTIGSESFRGCSNLREMVIPNATESIGESAFRDCVSMTSLTVQNECIKIGERAFENCSELSTIVLPDGLTEIYGGVFNSCRKLKSITLPAKLTILGESAFSDCTSLDEIEVPDTVTKIDDLVFNGCTSLKRIALADGLKKIGKGAFKNCSSLKSIVLPATVASIGDAVFRGCKKLTSIKVDPKSKHFKSELATPIGSKAYVLFNKNKSILYAYPAAGDPITYTIPDSVVTISDWAFCEAERLASVVIPDCVQEIGEGAFNNCHKLQEIIIPDSVTHIDDCAFRGCSSLEKVVIPDSVVEFGWGLFDGCDNITVYCNEGSPIYEYCLGKKIRTARIEEKEAD